MKNLNKISTISILGILVVLIVLLATGKLGNMGSMRNSQTAAAVAPDLLSTTNFSVLAALSASSANTTTISGDLGLSPGLAVSRTGPWVIGGSEYFGTGGVSEAAQTDALAVFNDLAGQSSDGTWSLNPSPTPGVWTTASSATFAGPTLTLTGDYDDVWVFQIGADFTFTGQVVMAGNAQPCNVFWQVGGDATIASGSSFIGTLIASGNITLVSGATVNGRIISLNGALTTDNNTISDPACVAAPALGTLHIIKNVINDDSGVATASDFTINVSGTTNISPSSFAGSETGVDVTMDAGSYTVTETGPAGYAESDSVDCSGTIASGETKTCTITNNDIATPSSGSSSSGSSRRILPPLIDVIKIPTPLALPDGPGSVTYTYTLNNIGMVSVENIIMVDDTCSSVNLISGDINNDTKLDTNEQWIYSCSTNISKTHTNIVTTTGFANGINATDVASATVVVGLPIVPPLIHVTKIPNPLILNDQGGMVTYTEKVTNPGVVALSNINLTDDKCSPMKYISGDINKDSKLDITETWLYTCTTNLTKTTTNTATVTGEANNIKVKDFAIATVVVGVPGLPNTGFSPEKEKTLPIFLKIPKLNINAEIESVGITSDGRVDVPKSPTGVAWFNLGPRPGEVGSSVIDGHSGYKNNIPAVFDNLYKLNKGDKVYVENDKGVINTFVVRKIESYDKDENVPNVFTESDGLSHLNLITCSGDWNEKEKSHSKRLVVFTDKE